MEQRERRKLMHVWSDMKRRCHKQGHHAYHNYGGRGITVCRRWRDSFQAFLDDMGPRPSSEHSIERLDNDQGYSPENCVWATRSEQNLNKRDYRNNTSGLRNIEEETRVVRGRTYHYWRVRIRRNGKIVASKRFLNVPDAVAYRDRFISGGQDGRA